jgi:hypothetical protein
LLLVVGAVGFLVGGGCGGVGPMYSAWVACLGPLRSQERKVHKELVEYTDDIFPVYIM